MKTKKENRKIKFTFEVLMVIVVFFIFYLLLFRYYGSLNETEKLNPRFVQINYEELEISANSLEKNYDLNNKTAKNVFVLNYHVITNGAPTDPYEISYEQFRDNMFALKSQGYQTVSLDDFYLFMRGEKELPDKSFVLTFDDGAKSAYYNADPVLKVLNYTAVMFVITGSSLDEIDDAYYLNKSELAQAQQTGRWELESHTDNSHFRILVHPNGEIGPAMTNKYWFASENRFETDEEYLLRVSEDLKRAKSLLEENFNKTVIGFALPFGDFGEPRSNYVDAHKILYNLTTQMHKLVFYQFSSAKMLYYRGNYGDNKAESYGILRLSVDALRTPDSLLKEIEASRALELPFRETYTNEARWPTPSGEASFENNTIVLATSVQEGANIRLAYLDGSYLWKDYSYSLRLKNSAASVVLLISRLKTSSDYTACRYGPGLVRIINVEKGVHHIIVEEKITDPLVSGTKLSMSVSGLNVSCFMNNIEVAQAEATNISTNGGIGVKAEGFKTSDKTFAFGDIAVREGGY